MNIYYIHRLLNSLNKNPESLNLIEKILKECTPLLINTTKKYKTFPWKEDIQQVARIGLLKAIRKYNCSYSSSFTSFALIYISGEIKHFLRDNTRLIREPDKKTLFLLKAHKYIEHHLIEQHFLPSIKSLMYHLGCTYELALDALSKYKSPFKEIYPLYSQHFDLNEHQYLNKIYVENILKHLHSWERQLLEDFYISGLTQKQIAQKNNTSQAQVSILIKKISVKVRKHVA